MRIRFLTSFLINSPNNILRRSYYINAEPFEKTSSFIQIDYRPHFDITDSRIIMVGIDGTICTTKDEEYENSIPNYNNIDVFNTLYNKGDEIHYWTSRDESASNITIKQLNDWNVEYNSINIGKPQYDVWVDNKSFNSNWFCK